MLRGASAEARAELASKVGTSRTLDDTGRRTLSTCLTTE
jgi:hypothetical protein